MELVSPDLELAAAGVEAEAVGRTLGGEWTDRREKNRLLCCPPTPPPPPEVFVLPQTPPASPLYLLEPPSNELQAKNSSTILAFPAKAPARSGVKKGTPTSLRLKSSSLGFAPACKSFKTIAVLSVRGPMATICETASPGK